MHRRTLACALACWIPATADAARPDRVWGTYFGGGCGCREAPVPRDISLLALALLASRRRRIR